MQDLPAQEHVWMLLGELDDKGVEGGCTVRCPGDEQGWAIRSQAQGGSMFEFGATDRRRRTYGVGGQFTGEVIVRMDDEIFRAPAAQHSIGSTRYRIQIKDRQWPAGFSSDQTGRRRGEASNGDDTTNGPGLGEPA